jgi:hypothetical protein
MHRFNAPIFCRSRAMSDSKRPRFLPTSLTNCGRRQAFIPMRAAQRATGPCYAAFALRHVSGKRSGPTNTPHQYHCRTPSHVLAAAERGELCMHGRGGRIERRAASRIRQAVSSMNRFRVGAMPTARNRSIHGRRRTADRSSDSAVPDADRRYHQAAAKRDRDGDSCRGIGQYLNRNACQAGAK